MSGGGFTAGLQTVADPLSPSVEFLASQDYTVKRSGITIDAAAVTADGDGATPPPASTAPRSKQVRPAPTPRRRACCSPATSTCAAATWCAAC
jgi:hypothetical protein